MGNATVSDDDRIWRGMGIIGLAVCVLLAKTFVLSVLWSWFMTPLGVDEIHPAHVFGLLVMIYMFVPTPKRDPKKFEFTEMLAGVFAPFLILGICWCALQLM